METKVCTKCKLEKEISEFGRWSHNKDGYAGQCKQCHRERSKKYSQENPEKILETQKKWRDKNPDAVRERHRRYRKKNVEKVREIRKNWYEKNPKKRKEYRENYKPRKRERRKERRDSDPVFNLINRVRSRVRKYLKLLNITKKNRTFEVVGCTPEFLREHLEKQFKEGMTWDNKDKWQIDHITPLSSAKTEEELYKLCHYTNLQPLWSEENLKKSNKILVTN